MPITRTLTPLVATFIAALALMACSNAGGAEGSSPAPTEAVVTGEAVDLVAEQTALCDQIVAQGLPVDAASALAEASGYTYVVNESGEDAGAAAGTVVFTSADGIVVDCTVT